MFPHYEQMKDAMVLRTPSLRTSTLLRGSSMTWVSVWSVRSTTNTRRTMLPTPGQTRSIFSVTACLLPLWQRRPAARIPTVVLRISSCGCHQEHGLNGAVRKHILGQRYSRKIGRYQRFQS